MRGLFVYQQRSCRLSLDEAMAVFYGQPGVARPETSDTDPEVLRSHDACHVVFGLGTGLRDEMAADLVAVLATDVGLCRYLAYLSASPEARAQARDALTHPARTLLAAGAVVPVALRLAWRALTRRPRWPWRVPDELVRTPLDELRARYGVPVLASATRGRSGSSLA